MFLVVLQLIFLINPPGRSLGIDALLWSRENSARKEAPLLSFVAWQPHTEWRSRDEATPYDFR
jgi:hypothetical protein